MSLAFARFLFGCGLALAVVLIFMVTTWICLAAIRRVILTLADELGQDIASGMVIIAAVGLALLACHAFGLFLYDTLGQSPLVGGVSSWLAGNAHLSTAALIGATSALGVIAYLPSLYRWYCARAAHKAASRITPGAQKSLATSRSKAKKPAAPNAKRARSAPLAWSALFLLLLGGILLGFAYIVAPWNGPFLTAHTDASTVGRAGIQIEQALRARPVYYVSAALLGLGLLNALAWALVRPAEHT